MLARIFIFACAANMAALAHSRRALVTLVSSDEYCIGAQLLLCSYVRVSTSPLPVVVMYDQGTTSNAAVAQLRLFAASVSVNTTFVGVNNPASGLAAQEHTRSGTYTKFNVWNLDYDEVLYIDADAVILHEPEPALSFLKTGVELAYVGNQGYFNAGVMAVRPNRTTFARLVDLLRNWKRFGRNPTEQDQLIHYFKQRRVARLPGTYNIRPMHTANLQGNAVIVHAIGNPKPWTRLLLQGGASSVPNQPLDTNIARDWADALYGKLLRAVLLGSCAPS